MSYGAKNTPWGRPAAGAQQLNPQIFTGQLGGQLGFMSQAALNSLNAAGISVGALGGGMIPAVNAAAFATPQAAFTQAVGFQALGRAQPQMNTAALVAQQHQQQQQQQQQQQKTQRAFIGTVTKLQDQFGFIDDEVVFQTNVVRGAVPHVGDKVMVEAAYNPNATIKWTAFRIQLLPSQEPQPIQHQHQQHQHQQAPVINRAPPQQQRDDRWVDKREPHIMPPRRERTPPRRSPPPIRRSSPPPRRSPPIFRRRSPSPVRPSPANRNSALKREHSPARSVARDKDASRSPPRRKPRTGQRYNVFIPKFSLDLETAGTYEIRKRYSNMYVPSDFFHAKFDWPVSFPLTRPFSFDHSVSYHVMHKDVDCLNPHEALLDPPDSDYRFSAKVMLIALPALHDFYKKTVGLQEDGRTKIEDFEPTHPNRLINFLVGMKGKNEVLAIGGPWSPSLDGADPENDPRVLIKTAIRNTLALTGIDLSKCTQWYKFLEVRYRRVDKERSKDDIVDTDNTARVDTVVIFVPDIWNVVPTKLEFEGLTNLLKHQLECKLALLDPQQQQQQQQPSSTPSSSSSIVAVSATTPKIDQNQLLVDSVGQQQQQQQDSDSVDNTSGAATGQQQQFVQDKAEDETNNTEVETEGKPTHWKKLDIKSMKVNELRAELEARNLDSKGIKSQLVSKLTKAVKEEQETEEKAAEAEKQAQEVLTTAGGEIPVEPKVDFASVASEGKSIQEVKQDEQRQAVEPEKPVDEKELKRRKEREEKERRERKKELEKRLVFANSNPGIVVYPNKTAKGGKFDCKIMTLHSLLDYRQDDNKEHSFEVAMFAEAFSEMIIRDSAFNIYKALLAAPDKEDEKKIAKTETKKPNKDEKNSKTEDTMDSVAASDTNNQESMEVDSKVDGDTRANGDESQNSVITDKTPAETSSSSQKDQSKQDKTKKSEPKSTRSRSRSREKEDKKHSVVKDPLLLHSFSYFDLTPCGYLNDRDLEDILLSLSLRLTRAQVQKLLKKVILRDTLNYRKLTDTIVSIKDEKGGKIIEIDSNSFNDSTLLGNLPLIQDRLNKTDGSSSTTGIVDSSGTVVYQGTVVNVGQVLQQLDRLEKEQKILEQRHNVLEKDLKTSKEQKDVLERRKRRLEEDVRDYKKRLYDAEKCLKNSQDDTVQLKTSLQRCKEYGESICRLVDKTLPKREPSVDRSTKSSSSNKNEKQKDGQSKDETNEETGNKSDGPSAASSVKTEFNAAIQGDTTGPVITVADVAGIENEAKNNDEEFEVKDEIMDEHDKIDDSVSENLI